MELLEQSKYRARKGASFQHGLSVVDLGRHVTHVKIINMPLATKKEAKTALVASAKPMTDWDVRCLDGGLSGSFISCFRRFLACCPNIRVILDNTPQYHTEQCLPFLGAMPTDTTTQSTTLYALEYTQGGPSLWDICANPNVAHTLTRLRGLTLHFPPKSFPHKLCLPNLLSLDMHLSIVHHTHWLDASRALLFPSLSHLTVRTPYSAVPFIGGEAMASLQAFLAVHGAGLRFLELIVGNAPVAAAVALAVRAVRDDSWADDDIYDVPALLTSCPILEELVLDTGLIDPTFNATTLTLGEAEANAGARWNQKTLHRIGIRGSHVNAVLTRIAFLNALGSALGEATPFQFAIPPPSLSLGRGMCDFCNTYGHGDPLAAESVITHSLAILLGRTAPNINAASEEYSPPSIICKAMRNLTPLTEIYLLPPPLNAPRALGEIEMRPCCLRGAPCYAAIHAWQEQCRAEGVSLRFGPLPTCE